MSVQAFLVPKFNNDTTTTTVSIRNPLAVNSPGTVEQTIPLAGTIKRILIGGENIGDGTVQILRYPNGLLPSVALAIVPYVGFVGTGTTKITYEQSFEKDDALVLSLIRSTSIS